MSEINFTGIIGGTIAIGRYVVNDYVITITETEGDYGYTMTITKGDEVQTVTLYGLTSEQYTSMLDYLQQALTAATNAQTAAQEALTAAQSASTSASSASTDATTASQAASQAASSASSASQSASAASGSATSAATSASSASASAISAQTAQSGAESAQSAAETAASNASTSATNAAGSASQASQSATNAAGSATAAAQTLTQVQSEGAAQIAAIGAEGERVMESIPADYTALEGEVTELKSEIGDIRYTYLGNNILRSTGIVSPDSSYDVYVVDVRNIKSINGTTALANNADAYVGFFDGKGVQIGELYRNTKSGTWEYNYSFTVPDNAYTFKASCRKNVGVNFTVSFGGLVDSVHMISSESAKAEEEIDGISSDMAINDITRNIEVFNIETPKIASGLTITKVSENKIKISGTATGNAYINLDFNERDVKNPEYYLVTRSDGSKDNSASTGIPVYITMFDENNSAVTLTILEYNAWTKVVYPSIGKSRNFIYVPSGRTLDNVVFSLYTVKELSTSQENYDALRYKQTQIVQELTVGLPVLYLYGDTYGISKDDSVTLNYKYGSSSGYCSVKWQGSSSLNYTKKNYTINFGSDIDVGWGNHKKYCFKANYIDSTSAINICCAKLWSQIVSNRGDNPAISVAANNGAMDGFPVIIMLNDKFHGLYTWNTPKDKWTFGMGSSNTEYIVTAESHTPATQFKSAAELDGTDFDLEYAAEGVETSTVKTALNALINTVKNLDASGWENSVANLLDLGNVIDYTIFSALVANTDGIDKNYILTSYNGEKWFINAYDLDSTLGNHYTGGEYYTPKNTATSFAGLSATSHLFYLVCKYNKSALIQRYNTLRNGILSDDNVYMTIYNFCARIPSIIVELDNIKWNLKPGTYTNTLSRITEWYRMRLAYIDAEIQAMQS